MAKIEQRTTKDVFAGLPIPRKPREAVIEILLEGDSERDDYFSGLPPPADIPASFFSKKD